MSADRTTNTGGGIGIGGLIGVLFVALKLTHVIDWSWWLVLAPFWVPLALLVVIGVGIFCSVLISEVVKR